MLFGAAGGARRSRRACWPRCCCWPIATGSLTGGRWRRCGLICAGRWRWICRSIIPGFHPTSLVKFRARLLLHGKERIVFERSLELATELGLLDGSVEQIVDSTPMLGAAAIQDTVHAGPRRGAQAHRRRPARSTRARPARLREALAFDYARPRREAGGGLARQADARGDAGRGRHRRAARAASRRARTRSSSPRTAVSEAARAVARDRRPGVRAPPTTSERRGRVTAAGSRQIISAHDPEMRHGRKTNARRFTGYKLHVATDAQAPLVTAIAISPGNEHDGHHAAALVEQQPRIATPAAGARRHRLRQPRSPRATRATRRSRCSRRCTSPAPPTTNKSTRTSSPIDLDHGTVTCPQGKTANDPQAPAQRATRRRRPLRALCPGRLRALPAARALRAQRPPQHPHQPPRRPPPSRPARTRRPRPSSRTSNTPGHASNGSSD